MYQEIALLIFSRRSQKPSQQPVVYFRMRGPQGKGALQLFQGNVFSGTWYRKQSHVKVQSRWVNFLEERSCGKKIRATFLKGRFQWHSNQPANYKASESTSRWLKLQLYFEFGPYSHQITFLYFTYFTYSGRLLTLFINLCSSTYLQICSSTSNSLIIIGNF